MASLAQATSLAVLNYWHKIEFFIPYGLEQYLDDLDPQHSKPLRRNTLDTSINTDWLTIDVAQDKVVTGYNLFLGIFDKSEINDLCSNLLSGSDIDDGGWTENEERAELEGMTCFAKLPLDKTGSPVIDSISVSTAPWALGQTLTSGLKSLSYAAFDAARQNLILDLRNFMAGRGEYAGQGLAASEVIQLHALLCEWAKFTPPGEQPVAVLAVKTKPRSANAEEKSETEPAEVEEEEDALEELDILNSFYIRDIERIIHGMETGSLPLTLEQYLIPLAAEKHIDLYSEVGCAMLKDSLRPRYINHGHWLAATNQSMSLMQQFALNRIRGELQTGGLFAVNGPPGTGKTTLLRDLFADNIVQRARVLAGLPKADDAFIKESCQVRFTGDPDVVKLRPLIEALTGFEMVVASTNNAAVENISVDLIKRKALDTPWKSCSYLQPVAHNIAVQESRKGAISPQGDQMPWGLISCALGNSSNRRRFNERFSMFTLKTQSSEQPQRIWDWLKTPNDLSFNQAREAFTNADKAVSDALGERDRQAELLDIIGQGNEADYLAAKIALIQQAETEIAGINTKQDSVRLQLESTRQTLHKLVEEKNLIDQSSPGRWARFWRTPAARAYTERKRNNALNQLDVREKENTLQSSEKRLDEELNLKKTTLMALERERNQLSEQWHNWVGESRLLQKKLGMPRLPTSPGQLMEDAQFQIEGLWHDEELTCLRSELFAAALNLQQAWIHETGQKGGALNTNLVAISKVLANRVPLNKDHALRIWQNLFMIVPVVSSTFASFASQFRDLGPETLGWVFIDEAGQAVPQAAAGAIWRAKRCVVVGDPLQIEPVFTLPTPLINALGQLDPVTADNNYAPHKVSAQRLADQANRFGAYASFMDEKLWIGSPLRVHRRCHEPMFSLANRIAYGGKMVYGLPSEHAQAAPLIDLASGWVDIRGAVGRKQEVHEQIEFMTEVIVSLYQRDNALPELYVISPFKAIRQALRERLMRVSWVHPAPKRDDLKRWVKRSVGTVHTFQGKEEKTVFMVLGADPKNAGAAQWASSKPNLLNVALTRAQHRFYLIGDIDLWGGLPYFEKTVMGDLALPCWKRESFAVITQKIPA